MVRLNHPHHFHHYILYYDPHFSSFSFSDKHKTNPSPSHNIEILLRLPLILAIQYPPFFSQYHINNKTYLTFRSHSPSHSFLSFQLVRKKVLHLFQKSPIKRITFSSQHASCMCVHPPTHYNHFHFAILNGFTATALFDFDVSMHIPNKLINLHIPNIPQDLLSLYAHFCCESTCFHSTEAFIQQI